MQHPFTGLTTYMKRKITACEYDNYVETHDRHDDSGGEDEVDNNNDDDDNDDHDNDDNDDHNNKRKIKKNKT